MRPEALSGIVCTLFNYAVTQVGCWLHARAERELYERRVRELESLQQLGIFARELHVRAEPGQLVSIGTSYEDGWPAPVESFAVLSSLPIELIDAEGRSYWLERNVSLSVSALPGSREEHDTDNAGQFFHFQIKPEQRFFALMNESGVYQIPRGPPFSSPCYELSTRLDDFTREAKPRGKLRAWPALLLTLGVYGLAQYWFPDRSDLRMGLVQVFTGIWLFVCLSGAPFAAPFPRGRPAAPLRHWKPELR